MSFVTRFYVGMQDQDNGLEHNVNDLRTIASQYFDNFTMIKGNGYYRYKNGFIASETCYIIEVFHVVPIKHTAFIKDVKEQLNQESMLTYTQSVQYYLV